VGSNKNFGKTLFSHLKIDWGKELTGLPLSGRGQGSVGNPFNSSLAELAKEEKKELLSMGKQEEIKVTPEPSPDVPRGK